MKRKAFRERKWTLLEVGPIPALADGWAES
jgi:hypothetical protein